MPGFWVPGAPSLTRPGAPGRGPPKPGRPAPKPGRAPNPGRTPGPPAGGGAGGPGGGHPRGPGAPAPAKPPGPPGPEYGGRGPPGPPGPPPGRWKMGRRAACPGAGGGAEYVGRGPVCGMMTRRPGVAGASGTAGAGVAASTGAGGGGGATGADAGAALTGGRATTTPDGGGVLAIAGRSAGAVPGRTTTPAGGREAMAGATRAAGCTIAGAWRTCGTIRRGASPGAGAVTPALGCAIFNVGMTGRVTGGRTGGAACMGGATGVGWTGAAGTEGAACFSACGAAGAGGAAAGVGGGATATGAPEAATATAGSGAFVAGADVTTAGRATTAGREAAACSACLRSRMAFITSPGLVAFDRSTFWRASAAETTARCVGRPPVRCPRTFSASSNSMELECVFFSVTPTAVSASRISLLLTSSSRARSLIRTLLIRPRYSVPSASCAWQLHSRRNQSLYLYYCAKAQHTRFPWLRCARRCGQGGNPPFPPST